MSEENATEILIYETADKKARIDVRLQGETTWLSQKQMAELFQKDVRTINEHIRNIFEEGELDERSVIRKFRITASDGKTYETFHYNLDVAISVGYRVKSSRGTQFRIWATQRLREYLVKGFTLDDQRLAGDAGPAAYFDELLERVRAIRTSERMFWQKVTDIYATSIDYDRDAPATREFFGTVQNKFHFAIHGRTAAEVIAERADASKPNMGLTTWKHAPDGPIRKADAGVAKNYLAADELRQLNLIVDQYLSFAELQAQRQVPMHMADWLAKLTAFLQLNDREILPNAGQISMELAKQLAGEQFEKFAAQRRAIEDANARSDFDRFVEQVDDAVPTKRRKPSQ